MRSTKRLLLLALPAAALFAVIAFAFLSAQRALNHAADTTRTAGQLSFTLTSLDLTGPATPAFEPVATPNAFTCGAFLAGDLYLAGPTGLSIYAPDGTLRRTLRTGLELPVDPIINIVATRLRSSSDPQLLLATAGAGLLLLDPGNQTPNALPTLHQLLPATPELRDLTAILALPTGDLLLGTRHAGLLLFNGATLNPLRFTLEGTDPARLEVTALAAADAASILIGTRNSGVLYLHGGTVLHADTTSGLPDNQIESLAIAAGQAFAGTPLGIAQFNLTTVPDAATLRPARTLAPGLFTHALALNPAASELTAGTLDQGIQKIPLTPNPRLRSASISLPTPTESHQRIDQFLSLANQPGPLYALADGSLLLRTPSGWTPALPSAPATLTDRDISALAFDPTGRLYVGFFDRGLDILPPEHQTTPIRHLEDDHLFCINRLALDPTRQIIAAATANGLVLFDQQATPRQVLTRRDGLISDHISDIAFTRTGTTPSTVLATPAGLTFLTPTGPESLYAFQGLVNNHVYALAASPIQPDRLLAGTLGGLSLLENQIVRRNFTASNSGLKHNWITALTPLPDASTLLGTYGAGLLRLTTDRDGTIRFTPVDLPAATPHDLVINPNAILATPTHVYAGTLDHGLLVYSNATARWSNITHGLPSLNVTAFAARDGILYIGTGNGLVRIPEARLP